MARREWFDVPATTSPLSAALINDLEWRKPELFNLPVNVNDYLGYADPIQQAITVCSAQGGGVVDLPEAVWLRSTPVLIPDFVNVRGRGQSTFLRCTGNNYAVSFTGSRCSLAGVWIEKSSAGAQTSGGGIDFTSAGSDIQVDDVYFGSNLFYGVNAAPTGGTRSNYSFRRLRWLYTTGTNTAFRVGDGTNLLTDVDIREFKGTAVSTSGVLTWLDVARNVDSVKLDGTVYQGTAGVVLGTRGTTGNVTGMQADGLIIDTMSAIALDVDRTLDVSFGNETMIQTCGSSSSPGIRIGANAKRITYAGTVRNCTGDGILLKAGCVLTRLNGAQIYDNNTGNTALLSGVQIEASTLFWEVHNCFIANGVISTGHQKYGINIGGSATDQWKITDCDFYRNETAPILDASVGSLKKQWGNFATDAAGTAITEVQEATGNTFNVRDSTGADRVRLLTNGQVTINNQFSANPALTVSNGNVVVASAGQGVDIKEGTNGRSGVSTLVGGTVVVSTTKVTAISRIQLTSQADGGTPGWLRVSARTAATSFTILSSSGTDTSTVAWLIIEPA